MDIWVYYFLAIIPLIVGAVLWLRGREIVFGEWVGGIACSFILAGIFHFVTIRGMTDDVEIWSGQVIKTTHYPEWVEQYTDTETYSCGTDSDGSTKYCTRTVTKYRTHPEHWTVDTDIPDEHEIERSEFQEIVAKFKGGITTEQPHKSGFYSGDPNIYVGYNKSGVVIPTTATRIWQNKVRCAPSVFSFVKVPDTTPVFKYPKVPDWRQSDRLLGTAAQTIRLNDFDVMMATLGPTKRVNVIMAGFGDKPSDLGEWQRAKYYGGKKNDLVICYGGPDPKKPTWCKVFGWTDEELVKKNIESLILDGPVDTSLLPAIRAEIVRNYKIKDWSQFDYIKIEPPLWAFMVFLVVLVGTQAAFYVWAFTNEHTKFGYQVNRYLYEAPRAAVSRGTSWTADTIRSFNRGRRR